MVDSLAYQLDIRRIPKRKSKIILPSGREWEPNIEEMFDKEIDERITRGGRGDIQANDSIY
jgi:hypothetical protein